MKRIMVTASAATRRIPITIPAIAPPEIPDETKVQCRQYRKNQNIWIVSKHDMHTFQWI